MEVINNKTSQEKPELGFNGNFSKNTNHNLTNKVVVFFLFLTVVPVFFYLVKRNKILDKKMRISETSLKIDKNLKGRRENLIKLVDLASKEVVLDKNLIEQVAKLRSDVPLNTAEINLTQTSEALLDSDRVCQEVLKKIKENLNIKPVTYIAELISTITTIEKEINDNRLFYDEFIKQFNLQISKGLGAIIANKLGLNKMPLLKKEKPNQEELTID